MEQVHDDLLSSKSFQLKNGEKRIVYTFENFVFMFCWAIICLGLPISLIYLTKFMGPISTVISIFAGSLGLVFMLFVTLPLFGQFLRGTCVLKITNGNLVNHKISVPINRIKAVKIRKHPNPFKLWVYDYLVVTDLNNKNHYFNMYNIVNFSTVLSMIDVYVFNKKEI